MLDKTNIDKDNKLSPSEDYDFLKKEGIRLIQKLSGEVWTDYNTHDPGITLLEALCYTLTDLGYRTSFDIKDILTSGDNDKKAWRGIFYTAREILPSNPVTVTDYRKIIIDTEGVRNAWIEISEEAEILLYLQHNLKNEDDLQQEYSLTYDAKTEDDVLHLRGLYNIYIQYEDEIVKNKKEESIAKIIKNKLAFHRNLCEDFISVSSVDEELFTIEAEVIVNEGTDIEKINASIYNVIHDFLSPPVSFYSLEQMVERGYSAEEIFEGPLLKHGFIDTAELKSSDRFKDIHLFEILTLISKVEGVIAIVKFVLPIAIKSDDISFNQWFTDVKDKQKIPKLDVENSLITFIRSGDRHRASAEKQPDKKRVKSIYLFLQSSKLKSKLKGQSIDLEVPVGEFMDISEYYPFQKTLPLAYGMTETYIDNHIDDNTIKDTINEVLDNKVGILIRQLLNNLISQKSENSSIKAVLNLLLEKHTDELHIKKLIKSILDDPSNESAIKKILRKLIPNYTDFDRAKEAVFESLEKQKKPYFKISEKAVILQEVAYGTTNKSLYQLEDDDLNKVRQEYKKYQIIKLNIEKKKKLQLRGFLMLFEQIMSDYLSQLAAIREVFSFDNKIVKTFFSQILNNISDVESLFIDYDKYKHSYIENNESEEVYDKRRNIILDHLIARFSEDMTRYSFFVQTLKGKSAGKILINDKINFLTDYIQISNYRGKAFDYDNKEEFWNCNNVAGMKKRICRLLGIRDYNTKYIASDSIRIEKVTVDNKIERYVVVLTDLENKEYVLLKSIEYEFESEAREILNYILTFGYDDRLYIKGGHKDKWHYQLKKATQEGDDEIVATRHFNDKLTFESAFEKTIKTIKIFSEEENFHLIEHILLRPKVPARERSERKKHSNVDADVVELLSVNTIPDTSSFKTEKDEKAAYKFKIVNLKEQEKKDKPTWKLFLLRDDNSEILVIEEVFTLYKHLTRRIEQIRQFASDNKNYFTEKNSDGYDTLYIKDGERKLATSKRNYRIKEELDTEIKSLVSFFSYEREKNENKADNYDEASFYADPYSFQISIIIPQWPEKFRNPTFKHLLEKTIYLETPAHIYAHVYWLDHFQMRRLEEAYRLWLGELAGGEIPDTEILNNLILGLNELRK